MATQSIVVTNTDGRIDSAVVAETAEEFAVLCMQGAFRFYSSQGLSESEAMTKSRRVSKAILLATNEMDEDQIASSILDILVGSLEGSGSTTEEAFEQLVPVRDELKKLFS